MAYHNTDLAACTNKECRVKWQCLRWQIALHNDKYQTYLDGKKCNGDFFVESKT